MAFGFGIGQVLNQWQSAGIFDYLLPFLLIFAVIFGILNKSKILGENRGIHVIIAIVIGLLALQGNFVSRFFQPLFVNTGMAVAVLLVIIILVGLFINKDEQKYWFWGFGAIGFIAAIIAISNAFGEYGWGYGSASFYGDNAGWIIGAVLIIGLIIAVATSGGGESKKNKGD
ncbi:MAG: hypothetical protein AABX07_06470 [Nanoarchaeota archaeon]